MSLQSDNISPDEVRLHTHRQLALLGPITPPFRGGIAQYTTELRLALSTRCDLQTISFHRLYPQWLYPGSSDREPGQTHQREADVRYELDAINPLTWSTAAAGIAGRGCDLAVINWWTLFWAPAFALIARRLRARGIPVVYICHNLFDHDSGRIKQGISARLLSQADAYLVHASEQAETLRRLFPDKPVRIHPHPTDGHYPPATVVLPKRGRLELLFFGFIRPYKGLDVLIEALAMLADAKVYLTVVGEPWTSPDEIRKRVDMSGAPNVDLHLKYVDAADAANFFARADLIVLPYRHATGSAVAAIAYHYEKPVLATRVGGFPDVIEDGRTGFLVEPESPQQLADCIRQTNRDALQVMSANIPAVENRFTWPSLASSLLGLANQMLDNQRMGDHQPSSTSIKP